jgi:N-acetylglucosaminyldiphosphoundecaprenol N-acetyl-beta-D-mannosaminyltransferase
MFSRNTDKGGYFMDGEVDIFDIKVRDLSRKKLIDEFVRNVDKTLKKRVYNVNIYALNLAYECPKFRNVLASAELVFNDGYGVCLATAIMGRRIRSRHTPPDWIDDLVAAARDTRKSIFLLGDEPGVAAQTASILSAKHPGLSMVGTHHGFFKKTGPENEKVVAKINASSPHILMVGMGMPLQEFWIEQNMDRLNVEIFFTVGAAFRWYSGIDKRAPRWITDYGFEWLARFIRHPIKLFKRYAIGNPLFFLRLCRTSYLNFPMPSFCTHPILPEYCKICASNIGVDQ